VTDPWAPHGSGVARVFGKVGPTRQRLRSRPKACAEQTRLDGGNWAARQRIPPGT
jgi:hypothetical protein